METIFSRHRNTAVLIAVLFVQVVLLGWQVKRPDSEVPLIRGWVQALFAPPQRAISGAVNGVRGVWENYLDLRHARSQTRSLEEELFRQRLKVHELREQTLELQRLRALVDFKDKSPNKLIAARVIGSGATDVSSVVFINRGSEAGVQPNLAVITPEGIVGKVQRVFYGSAQVLLITDSDSGVGCILENSRVHGILKGQNAASGTLQYVLNDENVEVGEKVYTSGEDRIYPKGLPAGTVSAVRAGSPFKQITVQPLVRLNRLEEVLVVIKGVDVEPAAPAPKPVASAETPTPAGVDIPVDGPFPAATGPTPPPAAKMVPAAKPQTPAAESDRPGIPRGARPETDADKILSQAKLKAAKEAPKANPVPVQKEPPPKQ